MRKIGIFAVLALVCFSCQTEKTGFVDTEKLIVEFNEMKDAKERFTKQSEEVMQTLQLKIDAFEIKGKQYQSNRGTMSRAKQEERYNELALENQQLQQEQQARMGKIQVESQKVIDSLIAKVKDIVKIYGKAQGFSYIYGSNDAGSIMYGKDELDLTEVLLVEINGASVATKE
ncbi:MAG: outer membrane protein [Flavobacteriales bacterium]|jgi:outer membrane protein